MLFLATVVSKDVGQTGNEGKLGKDQQYPRVRN